MIEAETQNFEMRSDSMPVDLIHIVTDYVGDPVLTYRIRRFIITNPALLPTRQRRGS